MLINPADRLRRRGGYAPRLPGEPAPLVALVALAAEVACLRDLHTWEPCGALLDEIPLAARGEGSLTQREVNRLRTWAANWRNLSTQVRTFYTDHHDDPHVAHGLWFVLGTGQRPTGPGLGRLRRAYRDVHGYLPPIDLLPTPRHTGP